MFESPDFQHNKNYRNIGVNAKIIADKVVAFLAEGQDQDVKGRTETAETDDSESSENE